MVFLKISPRLEPRRRPGRKISWISFPAKRRNTTETLFATKKKTRTKKSRSRCLRVRENLADVLRRGRGVAQFIRSDDAVKPNLYRCRHEIIKDHNVETFGRTDFRFSFVRFADIVRNFSHEFTARSTRNPQLLLYYTGNLLSTQRLRLNFIVKHAMYI